MIRISLAGPLGFESADELLKSHETELRERFSKAYIKSFEKISENKIDGSRICPSDKNIHFEAVGEGGLFGTLWTALDEWETIKGEGKSFIAGCEVELEKVPVKQEVIEISELYSENPYETPSGGAWVIIWNEDQKEKFPEEIKNILSQAAVIGNVTSEKGRILKTPESVRFLTPLKRQMKDIQDRKKYN